MESLLVLKLKRLVILLLGNYVNFCTHKMIRCLFLAAATDFSSSSLFWPTAVVVVVRNESLRRICDHNPVARDMFIIKPDRWNDVEHVFCIE